MGRLQRSDETLWHQHQEARDVVQRLTAMNLGLWDDWLGLGHTDGAGDGQMHGEEEKTKGNKIKDINTFNLKGKIPTIKYTLSLSHYLPLSLSLRFLAFEILLKFCCAFTCTTNLDYSDICWAGLQTETGNEKCGKGNPDCGISRGWTERKMMDWNTVRSDNNTCTMKAEPPLCWLNPVNAGQPQKDSPLIIQVQHHTFWFDRLPSLCCSIPLW